MEGTERSFYNDRYLRCCHSLTGPAGGIGGQREGLDQGIIARLAIHFTRLTQRMERGLKGEVLCLSGLKKTEGCLPFKHVIPVIR